MCSEKLQELLAALAEHGYTAVTLNTVIANRQGLDGKVALREEVHLTLVLDRQS
jgi:hypothetical protein